MTRDALERAAQQKVRDERQQNRDHRRLARIERAEDPPLVDDVHEDAKNDDPRGRDDPAPRSSRCAPRARRESGPRNMAFVQTLASPTPSRRAAMIAIAGCRMKRNVIGPPGRSENVPPQPVQIFDRESIPDRAEDDEPDQNQDCGARLQKLGSGYRLGQKRLAPLDHPPIGLRSASEPPALISSDSPD